MHSSLNCYPGQSEEHGELVKAISLFSGGKDEEPKRQRSIRLLTEPYSLATATRSMFCHCVITSRVYPKKRRVRGGVETVQVARYFPGKTGKRRVLEGKRETQNTDRKKTVSLPLEVKKKRRKKGNRVYIAKVSP